MENKNSMEIKTKEQLFTEALYSVKIESDNKTLLDVKDISRDDAIDHCNIILKEQSEDKELCEWLNKCMRSLGTMGFSGNGKSISISAYSKFIKDPTGEKHTCGRRKETGMDSDNSPFKWAGSNLDTWDLCGDDLCCSYCGSIKPSRLLEIIKERGFGVISHSDKNYKWYVRRPEIVNASFGGIKYYRQHDTGEFINSYNDLMNGQKSKD